jgi:hypothetical protein
MGQLMAFYAGDPQVAVELLRHGAFDALQRSKLFADRHVDFSLHVSHIDLDMMTGEAQAITGSGPTSFLGSLEQRIAGDGEESAVEIVAQDWVRMIAAVQPADTERLLAQWARQMVAEYGDPTIAVTHEIRQAVSSLIALCRRASADGARIIHTWSL